MSDINLRLLGIWVGKLHTDIKWMDLLTGFHDLNLISAQIWLFWLDGLNGLQYHGKNVIQLSIAPFTSFLSSLQMLLHLFSDANYNLLGFNATYSFSVCPGACGGHGRCDTASSLCQCHLGWGGADCSTPLCPQACILHGTCDKVRRGRETLLSTLETAVFRQHTDNLLVYYSAIKQRLDELVVDWKWTANWDAGDR